MRLPWKQARNGSSRKVVFAGVTALLVAILASTTAAAAVTYHYDEFTSSRVEARRSPPVGVTRSAGVTADRTAALTRSHVHVGDSSRSLRAFFATEAERTVVIGRNMSDRVIPYAESNGADWYGGTPRWVPRGLIEK